MWSGSAAHLVSSARAANEFCAWSADKEVQEKIIESSALDWVIVRPSVLTNGPKRSVYRVGADVGNWLMPSRISRADVAAFMLEQVAGAKYLRQTPGLAD